jgi:hypothetical protein
MSSSAISALVAAERLEEMRKHIQYAVQLVEMMRMAMPAHGPVPIEMADGALKVVLGALRMAGGG